MGRSTPQDPDQVRLLLARWRESLVLHARYASLPDEQYWHVQPWPKHERPAPWIVALARQKVDALARLVEQRAAEGDRAFIEALEAMAFLANLVGLQSIERYIPLAAEERERRDVLSVRTAAAPSGGAGRHRPPDEPTREMPRPGTPVRSAAAATGRAAATPRNGAGRVAPARAAARPARRTSDTARLEALVLDDAVRLLGWGRQWHELAELIPRLADRPAAAEVRRILRDHRARIEKRSGVIHP
jgi:hypothetical protein